MTNKQEQRKIARLKVYEEYFKGEGKYLVCEIKDNESEEYSFSKGCSLEHANNETVLKIVNDWYQWHKLNDYDLTIDL